MRSGSLLITALVFCAGVSVADNDLRSPPGTPSKALLAIPALEPPVTKKTVAPKAPPKTDEEAVEIKSEPSAPKVEPPPPAVAETKSTPAWPPPPPPASSSPPTTAPIAARAWSPPPPPPSAPPLRLDPGGATLPGAISDSVKPPPALAPPPPVIEQQQSPEEAAAAAAADSASDLRATLTQISFDGNTLFTDAQLAVLVQDYLNREVSLAEIYLAADKVSDFYVEQGYSLAVVTVPAQKIAGGQITLKVLEGVIGKIETEDNIVYPAAQILQYLDRLKTGAIYRAQPLEDSLQTLNSLPGLQTKALIKPGENPGASDIVIKTQEKRFAGTLGLDNFGRSNTGALRGTLAAQLNNPLHLADQLQFVTLHSGTGGLRYYYGGYSLKPFVGGPRIGLSYGEATFQVAGAPVDGVSRNGRFNLDYALLNSRAQKLNLGGGATRIISSVNLAGAPQPVTSITTFDLSASYNLLGDSGEVTAAVFSLATDFRSNSVADCTGAGNAACRHQMLKFDFGVQRLQPILPRFDALIRFNAAYSPEALPDSQQFSAGGPGNVRAFRSAEIRGDLGYNFSTDLRYGIALGEVSATPRLFFDYAEVGTADSAARGTMAFDSIADYGFGVDLAYQQYLAVRVDVALPIQTDFVPGDGTAVRDARVYASTSLSY